MLERLQKFLISGGPVEVEEVRGEGKTTSKGLNRFVTALMAGAIAFNSLASFGAVIAGDHLAQMEDIQLEQRFDNTMNTIQGVIDGYQINKTGFDGPTKNVSITGVRVTDSQVGIAKLMSAVKVSRGDFEGSYAMNSDAGGKITIDPIELNAAGLGMEFGTLHEIGHTLITHTNNYMEMDFLASYKIGETNTRSLMSVYAESHADVYAVLKIAQVQGVDAALNTAHRVYEARKAAGDFGEYSNVTNSHDSSYALEQVTDYLMHHPEAKGMSEEQVYKLSIEYGIQSMDNWMHKHNIQMPEKTSELMADSARASLEDITSQNVNIQFSDISYATNYMQLLSNHLLSSKFLNQQQRMAVNVDQTHHVDEPKTEPTWSSMNIH